MEFPKFIKRALSPEEERDTLKKRVEELETETRMQDAEIGLHEWDKEVKEQEYGIDHLTGASTRKAFEQKLEQTLSLVQRGAEEKRKDGIEEVSLISMDIDHFKKVNDTLGHPVGDEVLRRVAAVLMSSVRETDAVGRMGGEELMVLLPGATIEVAARHAEELREKIEQLTFDQHPDLKVTASFGVISSNTSTDAMILETEVDKALYTAKHGGRNRVEVYQR